MYMVLYACITQNNKTNIGLEKTEKEKENPNESCRQTVRGFPTELDKANMHRQTKTTVQFKMVSMRSEKPTCASPRLSDVSLMLPLK